MAQIFGNFVEQAGEGEYLKIGFHPTSIPLRQRWRNNGLSADFLADYLSTFFPGDDNASSGRQAEIKDAVSYIANELLENAMKFSYASSQHRVTIEMFLESHAISLYAINGVAPDGIEPFQRFIQRLLSEDLDKLYTEQLERNTEDESSAGSGLGFLTMLNDYKATMAWKFSSSATNSDEVAVTTMVKLPV